MYQKPDFLSDYEFQVLQQTYDGLGIKEIAQSLGKSETNIRKTRSIIRKKIEKELKKVANTMRLDTETRNMPKGTGIPALLIGYDWVNDTHVYLILTGDGVIAWYEHDCSDKCKSECQLILNQIQRERHIELDHKLESESPMDQFRFLITEIIDKGG
ncbi:MAG: LuxR C-terminal-related transcriptional regulator [Candidatus Hermodarchaeota archaeon]